MSYDLNDKLTDIRLSSSWLSAGNSFQGGGAKSIVMQISFVMLLFLDQISGGGKLPQGGAPPAPLWKKPSKCTKAHGKSYTKVRAPLKLCIWLVQLKRHLIMANFWLSRQQRHSQASFSNFTKSCLFSSTGKFPH